MAVKKEYPVEDYHYTFLHVSSLERAASGEYLGEKLQFNLLPHAMETRCEEIEQKKDGKPYMEALHRLVPWSLVEDVVVNYPTESVGAKLVVYLADRTKCIAFNPNARETERRVMLNFIRNVMEARAAYMSSIGCYEPPRSSNSTDALMDAVFEKIKKS